MCAGNPYRYCLFVEFFSDTYLHHYHALVCKSPQVMLLVLPSEARQHHVYGSEDRRDKTRSFPISNHFKPVQVIEFKELDVSVRTKKHFLHIYRSILTDFIFRNQSDIHLVPVKFSRTNSTYIR